MRVPCIAVACWLFGFVRASAEDPKILFPQDTWETVKPETVGYSSAKLAALRSWLSTQQTTALHVSVGGALVFEYGDVKRVSKIASVRKSVLAMLLGTACSGGHGTRQSGPIQ